MFCCAGVRWTVTLRPSRWAVFHVDHAIRREELCQPLGGVGSPVVERCEAPGEPVDHSVGGFQSGHFVVAGEIKALPLGALWA